MNHHELIQFTFSVLDQLSEEEIFLTSKHTYLRRLKFQLYSQVKQLYENKILIVDNSNVEWLITDITYGEDNLYMQIEDGTYTLTGVKFKDLHMYGKLK